MSETPRAHLPRKIDSGLAIALGEMVIAYGRLEHMFKFAIKRLTPGARRDSILQKFSGNNGNLGNLVNYCIEHHLVVESATKAKDLNRDRHDFIHATIAAYDEGQYVRFRDLFEFADMQHDIVTISRLTYDVNKLIEELDQATGSSLTDPRNHDTNIATLSAPPRRS